MIIGRLVLIYRKAGLTGIPYDDKPVGHTGNAGSPTTYCLGLYAEKDGQELNVAQLFARGEEISL